MEPPDQEPMVERAFGTTEGLAYESRGNRDLVPDKLDGFDLAWGEDADKEALLALMTALDAIDTGQDDVLSELSKVVDMDRFLRFAAIEILLGQKKGYAHGTRRYALHQSPDDERWSLMPLGLEQTFQEILDPLGGNGRIHKMCLEQLSCRLALADEVEEVADLIQALEPMGTMLEARPFVLEQGSADPFLAPNVEEIEAAIDHNLAFLSSSIGWVIANLVCADPANVDKDGDGFSGCGEDCDDDDPAVHPEAEELCNIQDDDCDGALDNNPECPGCLAYEAPWGKTYDRCFHELTWQEAEDDCVARGGHLASVGSEYQQQLLKDAAFSLWVTDWWIGLNDLEEEGTFVWSDGSEVGYENWNDNEPNDSGGEDCTHFSSWGGGGWNDLPCDRQHAYLCEFP